MPRRLLAQVTPSTTAAELLYSCPTNAPYEIDLILCTNNTDSAVSVTIYHDADGTTYTDATCILATVSIAPAQTLDYSPAHGISGHLAAGSIGIKASTADSVAFTAYGTVTGEKL